MKKIALLLILFVSLSVASKTNAQVYYVYDGDTFNILLTCNDNSVIEKISFSSGDEWVDFKIVNWVDTDNGFLYTVKDGKNKVFTILYQSDYDYVTITNASTGKSWYQYRREE